MSPFADYECRHCHERQPVRIPSDECLMLECLGCTDTADWDSEAVLVHTEHRRVWPPVSIGRVQGAGGSPSR